MFNVASFGWQFRQNMCIGIDQNKSLDHCIGCVLLVSSVFFCSLQAETAQQTASEKYEHISEVAKQGQWEAC